MKKYVLIGIGGFLGAISRYSIKNVIIFNPHRAIPLNTLLINISGSFILAFFLTAAFKYLNTSEDIRIGISTGFLGAYTTFSALCKETVMLLNNGSIYPALLYLALSSVLGLGAIFSGVVAAKRIAVGFRLKNLNEEKPENNTDLSSFEGESE